LSAPFASIGVVGSGAIGLYYGTRLAQAGADVRFLLRGDLEAVRARGSLVVRTGDRTEEWRPVRACATAEEIGPVDLVLVTLKTTANTALAQLIPPLLKPATVLLTLQNGLGSDEALAAWFGPERVLGGLAFIASSRTGPGEVTCYHPGSITLGEFGRPPGELVRRAEGQFQAARVKIRVAENLASARWHKLVWNIPFNGLAIAAGGVPTDHLCRDPILAEEIRALMREVQSGARALGHTIADAFLQQQFDVTPPMGPYRPSSLVDYLAGREVEVESIWGEPLRRAERAGARLPRLALLYAQLCRLAAANLQKR
jgi:2-dehydropantoate 2-reductase